MPPQDVALLQSFGNFAGYIRAVSTPNTKLVSGGSGTIRRVLAANAEHHLITVNTIRRQGESIRDGGDYVETMPLPLPTDRSGVLGYMEFNADVNKKPGVADISVLQRGRPAVTKDYGPLTLIEPASPLWGFAPVLQNCVQQWANHCAREMAVKAGGGQRGAELLFAETHFNYLEPENWGRAMLNPGKAVPLPAGNPFAPLMALCVRLQEREDRLVLYRALGLEMMKITYAIRLRHVADPRGMGLRPSPVTHEKPELLTLAQAHAEHDVTSSERARDLSAGVHHSLVRVLGTLYKTPGSR
ncbi:MAG TPA: hypothetical protein PKV72_01370 [Candidatus Peribacteria bacterium]|nr:hypothetical protein [Candidatus Peribacteria bacterium]